MSNTITLHLGRRFEDAELHLHLHATQEEIEKKLTWLNDYPAFETGAQLHAYPSRTVSLIPEMRRGDFLR